MLLLCRALNPQEELAAVKAASGDAQQLQQQVQEQTSTIRSLQVTTGVRM